MKKFAMLMLAVMATVGVTLAQEVKTPDFKNTPMLINSDGSLTKLEKLTGEKKSKTAGGPWGAAYGGAAANMDYMTFDGTTSAVRVDAKAQFIVKLDEDTDPESTFKLTTVIVNKKNKNREVYTKKSGGKSVQDSFVSLTYDKIAPGVYKITTAGLTAGTEYAFMQESSSTVFLFGVN